MTKHEEALKHYKYNDGSSIYERINNSDKIENQKDIINSIVLWKINRTPYITEDTIKKILVIKDVTFADLESRENDISDVIIALLDSKGVRIPVGSTILHFYNPKVFPIIDQRAYRELYSEEMPEGIKPSSYWANLYIKFVKDCKKYHDENCLDLPFERIDQILYQLDKDKGNKVKGYGNN